MARLLWKDKLLHSVRQSQKSHIQSQTPQVPAVGFIASLNRLITLKSVFFDKISFYINSLLCHLNSLIFCQATHFVNLNSYCPLLSGPGGTYFTLFYSNRQTNVDVLS